MCQALCRVWKSVVSKVGDIVSFAVHSLAGKIEAKQQFSG